MTTMAYTFGSPSGVPGDISRTNNSKVEPAMLVSPFPSNYATAMKFAQGPGAPGVVGTGVTPFTAADVASDVVGFLARAVPGISGSSTAEDVDTFEPNPSVPQGLMTEGFMSVQCNAGTPVRGQPVFIVKTASAGHPVGAFETTDNGGNNIPLTGTAVGNVTWASDGKDTFGNAEIRVGA